ncbi:MAG TPA: hypothetical protein VMB05_12910 [Solirubrobacteraceae bacterium]|nr:hypothetical protein [Solirubrobacteraceae bacterium]HUB72937.1 hypothetical protein [Solirubrobacteraceae bacterium]
MPRLDALMLLRAVREVASHADAENPVQVSQRCFDAARQVSRAFANLPRAHRIAECLRMPWRDVLVLAHAPASTHAHRLGRAQTEPAHNWLTHDLIAFALRLVALRLNVQSVSPVQYRTERAKLLREDHAAYLHGRQLRLPSEDQIRTAMGGDWGRALALADLAPRPPRGDQGRGKYAPTTAEILDRAYEIYGTELTSKEIWVFVAANSIPYGRERGRLWAECVSEWKQMRAARGLDVPAGPPPLDQRPDYSRAVGAALPGETRRQDWSDVEDCLPYVIAYLRQLRSGERSTKRGYQEWARERPEAPSSSSFDAHGGWDRVRALALARTILSHPLRSA